MAQSISGSRRAAILLAELESDAARLVLQNFSPQDQQRILVEVARLEHHPAGANETAIVLREFQHLRRMFRPTGALVDALISTGAKPVVVPRPIPFAFLKDADADQVLSFVKDEHPQTISLVLASLPPARAARVLDNLPLKTQVDVIRRLTTTDAAPQEVLAEVGRSLETKLRSQRQADLTTAAAILNRVRPETEVGVLEGLDPEFAGRLREMLFSFEDLAELPDADIAKLLETVDLGRVALALKLPVPSVAGRFFKNLPADAGARLQQAIDDMEPVTLQAVTEARAAIVAASRTLRES